MSARKGIYIDLNKGFNKVYIYIYIYICRGLGFRVSGPRSGIRPG